MYIGFRPYQTLDYQRFTEAAQVETVSPWPGEKGPVLGFLNFCRTFLLYARLWVAPVELSINHDFCAAETWADWTLWAGLGAFGLFAIFSFLLFRRGHPAGLGGVWVILLFSPAMQIIPTPELAVERFLYPVLPGAALLLAAFLIRRPGDLLRHIASPFARPTIDPLRLLALLILVLCIARTLDRNRDWHDDLTLNIRAYEQWEGAEGKFRLGTLLLSDGQIDRARETLEEVVRIDPGHPAAWRNLGLLYWKMGRADDAEKAIRKSTEIEPEDEKNREALKWIERSSQ